MRANWLWAVGAQSVPPSSRYTASCRFASLTPVTVTVTGLSSAGSADADSASEPVGSRTPIALVAVATAVTLGLVDKYAQIRYWPAVLGVKLNVRLIAPAPRLTVPSDST